MLLGNRSRHTHTSKLLRDLAGKVNLELPVVTHKTEPGHQQIDKGEAGQANICKLFGMRSSDLQ